MLKNNMKKNFRQSFEFQREKKQACSIFHAEFKSSAKKILVLRKGGQNRKKHLKIDLFRENKAVFSNLLFENECFKVF